MTANSIAYNTLQETIRHNGAMELLERRKREIEHNVQQVNERAQRVDALYKKLGYEENRANNIALRDEQHRWNTLLGEIQHEQVRETTRHNKAIEYDAQQQRAINWWLATVQEAAQQTSQARFEEDKRHNLTNEAIAQGNYFESMRSNRAHEDISRYQIDMNRQNVVDQVGASMYSANVSRENAILQAETNRANAELQAETSRHNADVAADAARYGASVSANASMYAADQSNEASHYKTDTDAWIEGIYQGANIALKDREITLREKEANLQTPSSIFGAFSSIFRSVAPILGGK